MGWLCDLLLGPEGSGLPTQHNSNPLLPRSQSVVTHFLCSFSFSFRLKQERESALTQLSQDLAAELTEVVVTECVRETCSQELK